MAMEAGGLAEVEATLEEEEGEADEEDSCSVSDRSVMTTSDLRIDDD